MTSISTLPVRASATYEGRTKRQSGCLAIFNLLLGSFGRKLTMHEIEATVTPVGIGVLFSCPMGMECIAIGCLFDNFESVVAQV